MSPLAEIAEWSFDLPEGWYLVPLDPEADERVWARSVIEEARADAAEDVSTDGAEILSTLEGIRVGLASRDDPFLCAAVSVQATLFLSVGCVLTGRQLELDPDDGPDSFAAILQEGIDHPGRGVRTLDHDTWRDAIPSGELVGAYQRFERRDLGDEDGRVADRVLYGIFPSGSSEMIALDFVAENLVEFYDIREDTRRLVQNLRVDLEALA